jgi:hypothetical protein
MGWTDHGIPTQKRKGRAGVEPATYRAATNCSTTELTPQRQPPWDRRPPSTTHASMLLRESQQLTHQAIQGSTKKCGGAGYRSLCLLHAKQALYHLSYTPKVGRNNLHRETHSVAVESKQKEKCANRESNPALKLGKLQCYRYTIGARLVRPTKVGVEEQGFDPCACRLRTDRSTE